jgi:RNA polymerase sigma-70 factor (ECF subfamily)
MTQTLAVPLAAPDALASPQRRLEELYRSSRDDVYAYVATVLGDRTLAEDVTALAFERAFRRRRLYRAHRGSERAWLFGIARNAALDELRRRKRAATPMSNLDAAGEGLVNGSASQHADATALRLTVQAALAQLDTRERELIALRFHAGLSHGEIARVLNVSESNAGTLLHRTITKLRKACDETL